MPSPRPHFDRLYQLASDQHGYFTTRQAAEVGYSPQALQKHLRAGRLRRVLHGIYRVAQYPPSESEQLVVVHLWAHGEGTFSHETALALHGLSDLLPATLQLTVPPDWRGRRLRLPPGIVLHIGALTDDDRAWFDAVRITPVARTLRDCLTAGVALDQLRLAWDQAIARGLLDSAAYPDLAISFADHAPAVGAGRLGPA